MTLADRSARTVASHIEARNPRPCRMDEHNIIDLLELQRLTPALLDHLTAMLTVEESADLLRVTANGLETATESPDN